MAKRKIERVDVHIQLPKDVYKMSEQLTKGYKSLTQVFIESVIFQYQYHYKSDKLIDFSISNNKEIIDQLQKETQSKNEKDNSSKKSLDELKAEFIARRNAKKEGVSND